MFDLKNGLRELIVRYVQEYFFFYKDFYSIPETDLNADKWAKLKAGHAKVENYKYNKVILIMDVLFTEYEQLLIHRALNEKNSNQEKGLLELFVQKKMDKLLEWLNDNGSGAFELKISSNLEKAKGIQTKPFIEIAYRDGVENFSMRFRPKKMWDLPDLSKVDLRDWILENKDNLI